MDGSGRTAVSLTSRGATRTKRDWALRYSDLGWRAFTVVAGQKRPLDRGWQQDATTDPDRIARYWRGGLVRV